MAASALKKNPIAARYPFGGGRNFTAVPRRPGLGVRLSVLGAAVRSYAPARALAVWPSAARRAAARPGRRGVGARWPGRGGAVRFVRGVAAGRAGLRDRRS